MRRFALIAAVVLGLGQEVVAQESQPTDEGPGWGLGEPCPRDAFNPWMSPLAACEMGSDATCTCDAHGNVVTVDSGNDGTINSWRRHRYDSSGVRLFSEQDHDGDGFPDELTVFNYDDGYTDPVSFDVFQRGEYFGQGRNTYDAAGNVVTYEWDLGNDGNPYSIHHYTYDDAGRLLTELRDERADGINYRLRYSYDDAGCLRSEETDLHGDGEYDIRKTFTYDDAGRVVLYESASEGNRILKIGYGYDASGNRVSERRWSNAGVTNRWDACEPPCPPPWQGCTCEAVPLEACPPTAGCWPDGIEVEMAAVAAPSATISAYRIEPEGVEGHVETVIVINGGPGLSHEYVRPLLSSIREAGARAVFYDQRGMGPDGGAPAGYAVSDYVADLEAVRAWTGAERVHLVAHSWGGAPAAAYLDAYPERVASLALLDAVPPESEGMSVATQNIARATSAYGAVNPLVDDCSRSTIMVLPAYFHDPAHPATLHLLGSRCRTRIQAATFFALTAFDYRDAARAFTGPVLIVQGASDPMGRETFEATVAAFPTAESHWLEACGHFPWEECADELEPLFRAFLGSLPSTAPGG